MKRPLGMKSGRGEENVRRKSAGLGEPGWVISWDKPLLVWSWWLVQRRLFHACWKKNLFSEKLIQALACGFLDNESKQCDPNVGVQRCGVRGVLRMPARHVLEDV